VGPDGSESAAPSFAGVDPDGSESAAPSFPAEHELTVHTTRSKSKTVRADETAPLTVLGNPKPEASRLNASTSFP
jgi:hypothetical protein